MEFIGNAFEAGPLWGVWLALFAAIEAPALFNKKDGDTLSEVLRYAFGFSKRAYADDPAAKQSWGMRARRGAFWIFQIWFGAHIGFGF